MAPQFRGLSSLFRAVKEQAKTAIQGKLIPESDEFETGFAMVLEIRKDLLNIESCVKKWLGSARLLSANAKNLAKAVGTMPRDIDAYAAEMDALLDDQVVLRSVTKKITLLDDLIRQRYFLRDLRLGKEGYERKLKQLEEMDRAAAASGKPKEAQDYDVQITSVQQKITDATEKYDKQLTELSTAVMFFVREAGDEGGTKLLAPELTAFRTSQFQFFLLCQKMIAGKDVVVEDLEVQWKAFARRMSTQVANARQAITTHKSAGAKATRVMWQEEDLVTIIPVKSDGAASETEAEARAAEDEGPMD
jgi:hypothetical protein